VWRCLEGRGKNNGCWRWWGGREKERARRRDSIGMNIGSKDLSGCIHTIKGDTP